MKFIRRPRAIWCKEFASRARTPGRRVHEHPEREPRLAKGRDEQRVRRAATGNGHERPAELLSLHRRREEPDSSEPVHPEPAPARRVGQDQARPRFAGRHVVPRRDGHEQAGLELGRTSKQAKTSPTATDVTSAALSQAIEVLRKRIDRFGVAEPVIQSAGGNRILIQLPGLSQSDKESASETNHKTAYLEFRMVNDEQRGNRQRHRRLRAGSARL